MCWSHAPLHTSIDWRILSGGKWLLVRHLFDELVEIAGAFETLCPDAAPGTRLERSSSPSVPSATARREEAYPKAFDPRIIGLTGSPQQIAAVEHAVGASARPTKLERVTKTTSSTMALTSTLWTPRANSCEA